MFKEHHIAIGIAVTVIAFVQGIMLSGGNIIFKHEISNTNFQTQIGKIKL